MKQRYTITRVTDKYQYIVSATVPHKRIEIFDTFPLEAQGIHIHGQKTHAIDELVKDIDLRLYPYELLSSIFDYGADSIILIDILRVRKHSLKLPFSANHYVEIVILHELAHAVEGDLQFSAEYRAVGFAHASINVFDRFLRVYPDRRSVVVKWLTHVIKMYSYHVSILEYRNYLRDGYVVRYRLSPRIAGEYYVPETDEDRQLVESLRSDFQYKADQKGTTIDKVTLSLEELMDETSYSDWRAEEIDIGFKKAHDLGLQTIREDVKKGWLEEVRVPYEIPQLNMR